MASYVYNLNPKVMDTNDTDYRNWDDLVFENRNRAYGAYLLRKYYADKVITGLFAGLALLTLILFSSTITGTDPLPKIIPPLPETFVTPLPPPVFEKPEPPRRAQFVQTLNRANTVPVVTTDVLEPALEENNEPSINSDAPVGDGLAAPGLTDVGMGEIPVEVPKPEEVVTFAELMPKYEGGHEAMMKFLVKKLKYPSAARRMMIEGSVYVSFIVNGDGSVRDVQVLRGIHPDCDKEAVRVVALLPGWIGGKQNGTPVGVRMVLPIKFTINQ